MGENLQVWLSSAGKSTPSKMASTSYELSLPPNDALPYYDDHLDKPGMREKVERAIAREMKNGSIDQISEDRLPPPISLFEVSSTIQAHKGPSY